MGLLELALVLVVVGWIAGGAFSVLLGGVDLVGRAWRHVRERPERQAIEQYYATHPNDPIYFVDPSWEDE